MDSIKTVILIFIMLVAVNTDCFSICIRDLDLTAKELPIHNTIRIPSVV